MLSSWEMFYFNREIFRGTVRNQGEHRRENWGICPQRKGRTAGDRDRGWVGKGGWGEGWGGCLRKGWEGGERRGRQNLWVCEYFTFTMCVTEGERKTTAQLVLIPELARSGTETRVMLADFNCSLW